MLHFVRVYRVGPELDSGPIELQVIRLTELWVPAERVSDHERSDSEQVEPFEDANRKKDESPPLHACPESAEYANEQQNCRHNLVDFCQGRRLIVQPLRSEMLGENVVEADTDGAFFNRSH
jgi:hypothetical protein